MLQKLQEMTDGLRLRWCCLEETWQRGYSWDYRIYRLREAFFPLLGEPSDE